MSTLRKYSMLIIITVIIVAAVGYSMGKKHAYADNEKESKQVTVD